LKRLPSVTGGNAWLTKTTSLEKMVDQEKNLGVVCQQLQSTGTLFDYRPE